MHSYWDFLCGLVKDPKGVSAPTPSSRSLAATIASKVNPFVPGLVVELGAGTGVVTAALLARGVTPSRLVVVESNPLFCQLLKTQFPKARVHHENAFRFERLLSQEEKIAAVVSGLPLLNFPSGERRALIEKALAVQGPHGRFIQLSYGWHPATKTGGTLVASKQIVWRNLPPAHVWVYSRNAKTLCARPATGKMNELAVG